MSASKTTIRKPQRWDQPFDPSMNASLIDSLICIPPFSMMDPDAFSKTAPLNGILQNDCRVHDLKQGDIIFREGDYGSSAFLILEGEAIVSLKSLPNSILGRQSIKPKGWSKLVGQLWQNSRHSETRDYSDQAAANVTGERTDDSGTRVYLHDIPRVIRPDQSLVLQSGEIFGEISALTRSPRSATVVANSSMKLLEIRWQGFRELLKRDAALKTHVQQQYRENGLRMHLQESDLLQHLPADTIETLAAATTFESFGNFQWNHDFQSTQRRDISDRIQAEPRIAAQGEYVNGLVMIRSGFARLSRHHGSGEQTIAYLGKGQVVGLRELVHNWKTGEQRPWLLSLRAVGYVDVLRIPSEILETLVLPTLKQDQLPAPLPPLQTETDCKDSNRRLAKRESTIDPGLMEFLVEKRLINGTQAMVLDLDRCTRCDDCVRACAATHDNNPRFNRTGVKHDHWMIANACMHCLDPVCMIGCPTGAIGREQESGNITINDRTCIGCSTCANSCPYSNIQMVEVNDRKGKPITDQTSGAPILKATKCDFCVQQSGGPACQRACPHDALTRIDLTTTTAMTQRSLR